MPTNAEIILARGRKLLAPPERVCLSDWSDAHRRLSSESSATAGPWRTLPFQAEPLNAIAPGSPYEMVAMVWASQLGKSELLMNLLTYVIAVEPGPCLLVEPTLAMCEAFSKDRIAPLLRDSSILKGKVADPKSRDAGSTIYHRRFTGGHLTLVGSNSPAGLAARPIRYLLLDEIDRYEETSEGDAVRLAIARTRTFWNRKIVLVSSPTVRGSSRIEPFWLASDQREYEVPCVHCGHFQQLRWDRVEWPEDKPEEAFYRCEACNELIPHHHKDAMVAAGRWQAKAVSSSVAGFHLSELVSPWRSWGQLAADWLQMKDDPSQRRVFTNTTLAEWFAQEVEKAPEAEVLAARVEAFPAEVPAGGMLLTCGCDIQADRIEAEVVAWAADHRSWSVAYVVLMGSPEEPYVWQQLDELLRREFRHESGMPLRISATAVDCGYRTTEVLNYTKDRFGLKVYGIKGLNFGWSRPIWPRKAIYNRSKLPFFLVSVDEAKRWFYQRLKITDPASAGYCHFPSTRNLDYFIGLTAETLVVRHQAGRVIYEWKNLERLRNEPVDCRIYAIAALFSLLTGGLNLSAHCEAFERMLTPPANRSPEQPRVTYSRWMYPDGPPR